MKDVKVAVVGLGKMGILHTGILSAIPGVRVVALCDKSKLITKFAKKIFGNKICVISDIVSLVDMGIDAICVTTPIPTHFKIIKTIYEYGIASNVFVEKPLALSYDESVEICQLSKKRQGVTMVGYQKRYCVTFNKAHELLEQEVIGEPVSFNAYAYSSDFIGFEGKNLRDISLKRGGVLRDLGAHAIDLALWYFGSLTLIPNTVTCEVEDGFDRAVRFSVQTKNGAEGFIETSWCKHNYRIPEIGVKIVGKRGALIVNDDKLEVDLKDGTIKTWYRHDLGDNVGFLLGDPEYYREDEHFINCIKENSNSYPDFSMASKVDYIVEQVYQKVCCS